MKIWKLIPVAIALSISSASPGYATTSSVTTEGAIGTDVDDAVLHIVQVGSSSATEPLFAGLASVFALPRAEADLTTPAASGTTLVLVDGLWVASHPDLREKAISYVNSAYLSGIPVVAAGAVIEDLARLNAVASGGFTGFPEGREDTSIRAMQYDPDRWFEREDGTLVPFTRLFLGDLRNYDDQAEIAYAVQSLAAWLVGNSGIDVDPRVPAGCLPGQACTRNHHDNDGTQAWVFVAQAQYNSYDSFKPHGRHNFVMNVNILAADGDGGNDWYVLDVDSQQVPGMVAWGNDWRNGWTSQTNDVDAYQSANRLTDHGPPSSPGTTQAISFGLSLSDSGGELNFQITYEKATVTVSDYSDNSVNDQVSYHNHAYTDNTVQSQSTFAYNPGVTVRDEDLGTFFTRYVQNAEFVDPGWFGWWNGFDVYQTGDQAFRWEFYHSGFASNGVSHDYFSEAHAFESTNFFDLVSSTSAATLQSGESRPCGSIGRTVWYRYVPVTSHTLRLNTYWSNFDTVIAAYRGTSLSALTLLGCNDDAGGTLQSELAVSVTAGSTYYIQVGGYNSQYGRLEFRAYQ